MHRHCSPPPHGKLDRLPAGGAVAGEGRGEGPTDTEGPLDTVRHYLLDNG